MAAAVAVAVGRRRGQANAVGRKADDVVRIVGVWVLQRTLLIQGDRAVSGNADGEGDVTAGGLTDDLAVIVFAQGDGFAAGDVNQAAGGFSDIQTVDSCARAVGTVGNFEQTGEAGAGVVREVGFVHRQGRCAGTSRGADDW